MSIVIEDRVRDTSTTTGTGPVTVSGTAPTNYRTFSSVCNVGDILRVVIVNQNSINEWEVSNSTYTTLNELTRTAIESSSNGGAAVNFSSGTKSVIHVLSATEIRNATSVNLLDYSPHTDGITPSDTQIFQWLNSGAANLYLPAGTYAIADGNTYGLIPTGVRRIYGPGTLKYVGTNVNNTILYTQDFSGGLEIQITFSADKTAFNQVLCLQILGSLSGGVTIESNFPNSGRIGIYVEGGAFGGGIQDYIWIKDCDIRNFDQSGVFFDGPSVTRAKMTGCNVVGPSTNFHCVSFGAQECEFSDNRVEGSGPSSTTFAVGIGLGNGPAQITHNTIVNPAGDGMDVLAFNSGVNNIGLIYSDNCYVSNGSSSEPGFVLGAYSGASVTGAIIANNTVNGCGLSGIAIASIGTGVVTDTLVIGNKVYNPNQVNGVSSTVGPGIAVVVSNPGSGSITGTKIYDNDVSGPDGKMRYGISEGTASVTNTKVRGNSITGATIANINLIGAGSTEKYND